MSAYAQTVSQLSMNLWKKNDNDDGGRTRVRSDGDSRYSNIARLLHRPNSFQTRSDFVLNMIYQLLFDGNAYYAASGGRYDRPDELFLLSSSQTTPMRDPSSNAIYYSTGGEFAEIGKIDPSSFVPSRYIGHVRMFTPQDPLIGVTPIRAAVESIAANGAMTRHQASFFNNMTRPSGVLTTDAKMNRTQIEEIRKAWEDHSKGLNSGSVPILSNGLNWQALSINSQDAQLVEAWKMSVEDISRVFRVPLPLINSMENSTLANAETLMNFWLSSGLGWMLRHIEENMEHFFDLDDRYEIEFDTDRLLRADFKGRMEALGNAVTKGIYSPDEARRKEGLSEVPGGHGKVPRVQQQMVPLDFDPAANNGTGLPPPGTPPAAAPEQEPPVDPEDEEKQVLMLARLDFEGMKNGTIH